MNMVKVAGLEKLVAVNSIVWIEGDSNYTRFHFVKDKAYLSSHTLKYFEELLPTFVRIHKSSLINPVHISLFEQDRAKTAYIIMSSGHRMLLAQRRINDVRAKLGMVAFQAQSFQLQTTQSALS